VRKQLPVLEKTVVSQIMRALKKLPNVVVRKRHGTAMGVAGDPDLYGSISGRHFEIEVKRPDDHSARLTPLQVERLQEWKIHGKALCGVAHGVEEALTILGLRKPEPLWLCDSCRNYTWRGNEAPDRCPNCGHRHFSAEAA
jgi:hypothetical protein